MPRQWLRLLDPEIHQLKQDDGVSLQGSLTYGRALNFRSLHEEARRTLLLERSRFQRDEEVQAFATQTGLMPRKQSHLVPKAFTQEDQKLAKLLPPAPTGI